MSSEYLENILIVDEGIAKIMKSFEEFFENDHKTAYIMTSDHGMTDWGNADPFVIINIGGKAY